MTPPTRIDDALVHAARQGVDRLDAQLLLLHALGKTSENRSWLIAHDTDHLSPEAQQHFADLIAQRLEEVPVAYLLGHKAFFGLTLQVSPAVLIPRPDTETLVQWALDTMAARDHLEATRDANPPRVLDLGTGSGAIALALKQNLPHWQVVGVDHSVAALAQAARNADALGLPVQWLESDWLHAIKQEASPHTNAGPRRFDLIVSNPPYIRDADPHLAALRHEPLNALTAGLDGLDDLRQIISQAATHLLPGAWLLLEHGYDQATAVAELLAQAGYNTITHRDDLAGITRCTGGCWRGQVG